MSGAAREAVVAVTGASRGIGAAIALELARRGFEVACLSRGGTPPAVPEAEATLAARLRPVACDVTEEASVKAALGAIAAAGPRLAGVVNNAGVHRTGPSATFSRSEFDQILSMNATAVFVVAREAYPHLKAAGGGVIVNIGSFFERLGVKGNAAYCASKAAVGAITRCLAVEWATDRIRVLDVAPGVTLTELNAEHLAPGSGVRAYLDRRIPVGAPSPPEPIARLVASLFSEDVPFLTGETITCDGGQSIAH